MCRAPSSGPRWCCISFIRDSSSLLTSRLARTSITPTMPHILHSPELAAASSAGRLNTRCRTAGSRTIEESSVQIVVLLDHVLEAELAQDALAAGVAMPLGRRWIAKVRDDAARKRLAVGRRNEMTRRAVLDQILVCSNPRGDDGQSASHCLEDGIGDSLGEGGQNETVEPLQHLRDICTFAGKPCELAHPRLLQDGLCGRPERSVADEHESHTLSRCGLRAQGRDKCSGEVCLVLDRLHPS